VPSDAPVTGARRDRDSSRRPIPRTDADIQAFLARLRPLPRHEWLAEAHADQLRRWGRGEGIPVELYLEHRPDLAADTELVLDLIHHEVLLREGQAPLPTLDEYRARFPAHERQLHGLFALRGAMPWGSLLRPPQPASPTSHTARNGQSAGATPAPFLQVPGYEIVRELGRGGMGVVYLARHVALNRTVALKMILGGAFIDAEGLARFRLEAESVARMQHPNIVQIFEVGTQASSLGDQFSRPYFSLEYVDGGTLAQRLQGQPQPARFAAALVEVLARTVHHAHSRGIVHRDLKPANVLLAADGQPKISDFGLAKQLDEPTSEAKTVSGARLGTPEYMAPEQAAGKGEIGPAADVWALGVLLYELLTAQRPFEGLSAWDTIDAVLRQEPRPPARLLSSVPRDLDTICLKCLRKEPAQRYGSADALAADLQRFLRGEPIAARRVGEVERAWKWARRRPLIAGLLAALAVLLVVGTTVSTYFAVEAYQRARDAEGALTLAKSREEEASDAKDKAVKAERRAVLAREESERGKRLTQRQAAELLYASGLLDMEAGAVDKGLSTMLRALRLAPPGPDTADFRLLVRRNLAAWARTAPALRQFTPQSAGRFVGNGKAFVTWAGRTLHRWDTATGEAIGPATGKDFPAVLCAVSADGERVVAWENDQKTSLRVYDARTGGKVGALCTVAGFAEGRPNWAQVELCPQGRVLVQW
jgi:serine/threonine protein kinase